MCCPSFYLLKNPSDSIFKPADDLPFIGVGCIKDEGISFGSRMVNPFCKNELAAGSPAQGQLPFRRNNMLWRSLMQVNGNLSGRADGTHPGIPAELDIGFNGSLSLTRTRNKLMLLTGCPLNVTDR